MNKEICDHPELSQLSIRLHVSEKKKGHAPSKDGCSVDIQVFRDTIKYMSIHNLCIKLKLTGVVVRQSVQTVGSIRSDSLDLG